MAQIENTANVRKGKSFSHNKKQIIRIDMTPMVDLGFLLITFFIFTTTMSIPKAIDLFMPSDKSVTIPQELPNSLALSLLLDANNKVYFYNGEFKEAANAKKIYETTYSTYEGIGKIIRQNKKKLMPAENFLVEGKD